MRLDAEDDEGQFPRHPAPSSTVDVDAQQATDERPVSQDTDSTEADALISAAATRDLDD